MEIKIIIKYHFYTHSVGINVRSLCPCMRACHLQNTFSTGGILSLRKQRFSLACDGKIVWKILSAYLRLLIFLLAILIPACASSKINVDSNCSHGIKGCMVLGRKAVWNLDSGLKSRDITLTTKICIVKAMVFPVFMYGCESWTIKKYECPRITTFGWWYCIRLLRVPWAARR